MAVLGPRRAILLALGLDIADVELPEDETKLRTSSLELSVKYFEIDSRMDLLDVTSHGDASRQFVRGPRRDDFSIECVFETGRAVPMPGEVLEFNEELSDYSVKASLLVCEVAIVARLGDLTSVRIKAQAQGGVHVAPLRNSGADPAVHGSRGIRLGGL